MFLEIVLIIIISYFIGSIPFGLVLCKMAGLGDIRKIGSGNIGATNVLRTGNKFLAALTVICDSCKGGLCVLAGAALGIKLPIILGFAAIIGHCYSPWLGFKGGKGFATTLGTLTFAVPFAGLAAIASWFAVAFITRISSLSALVALIIGTIVTYFIYGENPAAITLFISLFGYFQHRENIRRLIKGEESKISFSKK